MADATTSTSTEIVNDVPGSFSAGHVTTRCGVVAWRLAVLVVLLGTLRPALSFEQYKQR